MVVSKRNTSASNGSVSSGIGNNRCYCACKIDGLNSSITLNCVGQNKFDHNKFSADVWFYSESEDFSIFSQKDGFDFGCKDGRFYLAHPVFLVDNFVYCVNDVHLSKNTWYNVFISYDGDLFCVFLNGLKVCSVGVRLEIAVNDEIFYVGTKFNGLIRSIRLYKTAISGIDVFSRYTYRDLYKVEMSDILDWISFDKGEVKNLGFVDVTLVGSCLIDNFLQVLSIHDDEYIPVKNASVDSCFCGGEFSIYAKFFTLPATNKQVILSNGEFGNENAFVVFLKKNTTANVFNLCVQVASSVIEIQDVEIAEKSWNDILVSYVPNNLKIIVNGDFESNQLVHYNSQSACDIKIGNGFEDVSGKKKSYPFVGYITNVAIFNKALSLSDAQDFHYNEPFIFEDNLRALYNFSCGIITEMVSGEEVNPAADIIKIVGNTTNPLVAIPDYTFRLNMAMAGISEIDKMRSYLLIEVLFGLLEVVYGKAYNNRRTIEAFRQTFVLKLMKHISFRDLLLSKKSVGEIFVSLIEKINHGLFAKLVGVIACDPFADASMKSAAFIYRNIAQFTGNSSVVSSVQKIIKNIYLLKDADTRYNLLTYTSTKQDRNTMQNNNKAYGICVFESEGNLKSYIEVEGIDASFNEGFACDVWFCPTQDSYTLLSQDSGFSLRVEKNKFVFQLSNGIKVDVIPDSKEQLPAIEKNNWNNVFVSYDNGDIVFYLQGCPIFQKNVGNNTIVSGNKYKVGESFTGQIRSVRIYNKAMKNTEDEYTVNKYLCKYEYDKSAMKELVAWISFESGKMENLKGDPLGFSVHNVCYLDNAIQALAVSDTNYAYTMDRNINPINTPERQHAIFVKFFVCPCDAEKQVLFSNGDFYDEDALIIYLKKSSVCLQIGKETVQVDSDVAAQYNTWNDLLVTFKDGKAYFYLNGSSLGYQKVSAYHGKEGNGAVKLGNALSMSDNRVIGNPFCGYITTVAIFDQSLTDKKTFVDTSKPLDFHKNEPFIYEPGIIALFCFDTESVELISGAKIILSNTVFSSVEGSMCNFIGSVTGTNNSMITEPYKPYLPSEKDLENLKNNFCKKDLRVLDKISEILFTYLETGSGLKISTKEKNSFLYTHGSELLSSDIAAQIRRGKPIEYIKPAAEFLGSDVIVEKALQVAEKVGGKLCKNLCKKVFGILGLIGLDGIAIGILIFEILKIIKNITPDDPDDPDNPSDVYFEHDSFTVGATSNAENNKLVKNPKAALDVSYSGRPIDGEPTWVKGAAKAHPSVFVIDKIKEGIVKLKCSMFLKGEPQTVKVKITLKTEDQKSLFLKFESKTEERFVDNVEREYNFKLFAHEFNKPTTDDIYKYEAKYDLIVEINEKKDQTITIEIPMYSIPRTPKKPIGYGIRNAVITEFLDMLSTSAGIVSADNQLEKPAKEIDGVIPERDMNSIKKMMNKLYNCRDLQYAGVNAMFVQYQDGIAGFTMKLSNIQDEYVECKRNNEALVLGCETFSMIMAYGVFMHNIDNPYLCVMNKGDQQLTTKAIFVSGRQHSPNNNGIANVYSFAYHVITVADVYLLEVSGRVDTRIALIAKTASDYVERMFDVVPKYFTFFRYNDGQRIAFINSLMR